MNYTKKLVWITLFSIAMGFLESAVVIYLRQLCYTNGFTFPLQPLNQHLAVVELCREAATIIMLVAIGVLSGKNLAERFAWFIFSFAVWDIFYYVFLYVFLGWPQSLFSWDILFLIPVPWVGPVLAPVIISLTLILYALIINHYSGMGKLVKLSWSEVTLMVSGCLVVIYSFTEDYIKQEGDLLFGNLRRGASLLANLSTYVPVHFDWWLFVIGEGLLLANCFLTLHKARTGMSNKN